jgi:hypothetical protein
MTDGPTFFMRHDPRWHEIPLDGDVQPWADAAARRAWDLSGREVGRAKLASFASSLASVCELARSALPALALVFTPEPWNGATAIFLLTAAPFPTASGDTGDSRAAVLALLSLPDERLAEPQDVDQLETAAGPAMRVRKRLVHTGEAGVSAVIEQLNYAWPDPVQELVLIATTSFADPLEMGRWAAAVDDLARGMSFAEA